MDDELVMLLADLGSPEALANCIVENFKEMRIAVPVDDIAQAVGIGELKEVTTSSFEGVLVTDEGKTAGSIAYRADSSKERQRFTIAHEIGHYIIPTHTKSAQCTRSDLSVLKSSDARAAKEAEANQFAAYLLMPKKYYLADMRRLGTPETEHILKLAAQYKVSREAAALRYTKLSEHPCAVVFSVSGSVRWSCRSDDFPYLPVRSKDPLPTGCHSRKARVDTGLMSPWAEVGVDVWLDKPQRNKILYEQFFQQAEGYGLTMLTFDDADVRRVADDDEEEEVERAWTPPLFRK